ncbi:hypothetical protein A5630_18540 [Mycolicibacterium mucogenicum]|uniref:Uncharacterized protein n=1 Tax=Mycolicibacterium mucogenicum TaxID=56689 RepID=A0A1A3H7R2_MYCMU|nr:hypothetical protein [Mycolicibacterium mucogenicum]OBJ43651.1 hypothetical protein A5630_18540 [Mycolicibacterium mucogenicum]
MTSIRRGRMAAASLACATAVAMSTSLFLAATAVADPAPPAPPAPPAVPAGDSTPPSAGPHNVTYRARIDGVSRGTLITYRLTDTQLNSATPSLLPGESFEASAVLNNAANAGMQVSIQWPYSASLHCEILVDDEIVAQADQFVAPRLTPQRQDPGYGVLSCGSVTDFDPSQQYSAELPGTPATPVAPATPAATPASH